VQALTVAPERHRRLHDELVMAARKVEREPPALQQVDVERPAVQADRLERERLEVQEGGSAAAVEGDRRDRPEGRLAAVQV
jgi:hypothetical protein